jgi:CBS domain-containing protein
MLFPLEKLLEGREPPLSIASSATVRDALAAMIKHDYSQLPVVDGQGQLTGIVTEATLLRKYYHLDGYANFLELSIDHFRMRAVTMRPEDDLFDALDRLKTAEAIVVVQDRRPCGILTDYDTTLFFRDISEGLVQVQDIELTLRQHISAVYPDEASLNAALILVGGAMKDNPSKPKKDFEQFSFGNTLHFIIHEQIWPQFEATLGPKDLFFKLMDSARDIRNQLAHFRDDIDRVQYDLLVNALQWLATRPALATISSPAAQTVELTDEDRTQRRSGGRYDPLRDWLARQAQHETRIAVSFQQIEELLGAELPPSARQHRSWWSNDPGSHSQALAWLEVGWEIEHVDMTGEMATFHQTTTARSRLFFRDLLERIRAERRDIARSRRIRPISELIFSIGIAGFDVRSAFNSEGLRVEIYIDVEDYERNKAIFDALHERKAAIEGKIGQELAWRRIDGRRACRIYALQTVSLEDTRERLEAAKVWACRTSIAFVDTFRPLARDLTQAMPAIRSVDEADATVDESPASSDEPEA